MCNFFLSCLFRWIALLIRWLQPHDQVVLPDWAMRLSAQRPQSLVGLPLIGRYMQTARSTQKLEAQLSERCCIVATEGQGCSSKLLSDNDFL